MRKLHHMSLVLRGGNRAEAKKPRKVLYREKNKKISSDIYLQIQTLHPCLPVLNVQKNYPPKSRPM